MFIYINKILCTHHNHNNCKSRKQRLIRGGVNDYVVVGVVIVHNPVSRSRNIATAAGSVQREVGPRVVGCRCRKNTYNII